jgi:hypothetical protein
MKIENNQIIEQSVELLLGVNTDGLKEDVKEEVIYEINSAVTTLENVQDTLNEEENYIQTTVDV